MSRCMSADRSCIFRHEYMCFVKKIKERCGIKKKENSLTAKNNLSHTTAAFLYSAFYKSEEQHNFLQRDEKLQRT